MSAQVRTRPPEDPRRSFLLRSGWLDEAWCAEQLPTPQSHAIEPVDHYLAEGAPRGIAPNAALQAQQDGSGRRPQERPVVPPLDDPQLRREMKLVADSGLFDAEFYGRQLSRARTRVAPENRLAHFCQRGWRDALRPSPQFEVWWYWTTYLDPRLEGINPLVHFLVLGRAAGHSPIPVPVPPARSGHRLDGNDPRRICLFAGYDPQGVLDDTVVRYVHELSRFADVYYLSDGYLPPDQLARLEGITQGAWAVRHASYDFGSWSMLARELVGWDLIDKYDELILVNDSCYLLRSLDEVFEDMDARACDWWGMQATKGLYATQDEPQNQMAEPVPLTYVKDALLPTFAQDELYDFHVGSYFLVYRRPVIADLRFRRLLDSVQAQRGKLSIIVKYEIGLTRFLIDAGFEFDTFVNDLYPFHPIFTEWYYDLLRQGFPLLKKYLLFHNSYDVPDLAQWKDRILEVLPNAPVDVFERNLLRTSPHDELARSFAITRTADGQVHAPQRITASDFHTLDAATPKRADWWAFVVSHDEHLLPDNSRAIFDEVRDDPTVTKVVLTRSKSLELDGANVSVLPLSSAEGLSHLARCGLVLIDERPSAAVQGRVLSVDGRQLVLVRRGSSWRRVNHARDVPPVRQSADRAPSAKILTSSNVDQLAMLAEHYVVDYRSCLRTGIPALDHVLADYALLPPDLRRHEDALRERLRGRRLLLFLPAPGRSAARHGYRFSPEEKDWLASWSTRHHAVIGLHEAASDREHFYLDRLEDCVMDLSVSYRPPLPVLLRVADAVLTDVSGSALDFLVTGRPVVSFLHDYADATLDLLYDPSLVLPMPTCQDFASLQAQLDVVFTPVEATVRRRTERSRRLLHDHVDAGSARRAVAALHALAGAGTTLS